jgi:hypothetical protein
MGWLREKQNSIQAYYYKTGLLNGDRMRVGKTCTQTQTDRQTHTHQSLDHCFSTFIGTY